MSCRLQFEAVYRTRRFGFFLPLALRARSKAPCIARQAVRAASDDAAGGNAATVLRVTAENMKQRLDAFVSENLSDVTRARVQSSIREGLILVNGSPCDKTGHRLRVGDTVQVLGLRQSPPMAAFPESIPLDIVHEDEWLLVVNKRAGMVVHPAPGNYTGTLVNALLHHLDLPAMSAESMEGEEMADDDGDDVDGDAEGSGAGEGDGDVANGGNTPGLSWQGSGAFGRRGAAADGPAEAPVRPGIVHRIDKGTSGLLVVAKDDFTLAQLCDLFKARQVDRTYLSVVCGTPREPRGRVETLVARDSADRKRMTALPMGSSRGRVAVSNYRTVESLNGVSVVQWKLETGRTHQIRVHAKYMGHPLVMDDTYGGTFARSTQGMTKLTRDRLAPTVKALGRPALHAMTLGFRHPKTGSRLDFKVPPPADMQALLHGVGSQLVEGGAD